METEGLFDGDTKKWKSRHNKGLLFQLWAYIISLKL